MNRITFILKSLWFHRKSNLILLSGFFISVMVLTGALITGDSVNYSLKRIAFLRLGQIKYAMVAPAAFTDELAGKMTTRGNGKVSGILFTEAVASAPGKGSTVNRAALCGIDSTFLGFWNKEGVVPSEGEAFISQNIAIKTGLKKGNALILKIAKPVTGPANAPFTTVSDPAVTVRVRIAGVLSHDGMDMFSLKVSQSAPFNVFLNKKYLQKLLRLNGRSNILLAGSIKNPDSILKICAGPDDKGLEITGHGEFTEIKSENLFIPDGFSQAVKSEIPGSSIFLSWLVNDIINVNRSVPYSFVVATNQMFSNKNLEGDEAVVNSWLATQLDISEGDILKLKYFTITPENRLTEKETHVIVKKIIPVPDSVWDRTLMPEFPGISNALSCRDWESSTPVDLKKITGADEEYWQKWRGTPKMFISAEKGKAIWNNPYGNATAIRIPSESSSVLKRISNENFDPSSVGMIFRPVAEEAQYSAANGTDFGGLFLGLGMLIIISGLLLSGLLFSMQITSRISQIRTLSAIGFTRKIIFSLLSGEVLLALISAVIAGTLAGIIYTKWMLSALGTIWIPATGTSELVLHVRLITLITGAVPGFVVSAVILFFILIRKTSAGKYDKPSKTEVSRNHFPATLRLIGRNIKVHFLRNLGLVVLIALGILILFITAINRRTVPEDTDKRSGSGGFQIYAETSSPLPVKASIDTALAAVLPDSVLKDLKIYILPVIRKNDASCLNLNRVSAPDLTGVNATAFSGRFIFTDKLKDDISWENLNNELSPGLIPGFVDATVLKWSMGRQLGDTIFYNDDKGRKIGIRIIAALDNSIFQGSILLSDTLLRKYFPSSSRNEILLGEGHSSEIKMVIQALEESFSSFGMMAATTGERLAEFDTVQNTYLSVFLVLGGLGLLIASFGLGIFFVRDASARISEFALYNAIGFRRASIIITGSGGYLLIIISGIISGLIISFISLMFLPVTTSPGFNWPLFWLITAVSGNAFIWILASILTIIKRNDISSLRME